MELLTVREHFFYSFLPPLPPSFQPPPSVSSSSKGSFTTISGTRNPWKWCRNPLNPPACLSCLHSSRLLSLTAPRRRLQAPHHISHSALPCLSLHAHQGELHFMLFALNKILAKEKKTVTLKNAIFSLHMQLWMNWFQSEISFQNMSFIYKVNFYFLL